VYNLSSMISEQYLDKVVCADAWDIVDQLPDECFDLIFTDPVYENIMDYVRLAKVAKRLLKPNKPMIVWCSAKKMHRIVGVIDGFDKDFRYVYPIFYTVKAKGGKLCAYKMITWTTPGLIFSKGKFEPRDWFIDTFISTSRPSGPYKWNKNIGVCKYYIDKITSPGDVVWDPFTGYGVIPIACSRLGRHFVASEIDPAVAQAAQSAENYVRDLF